MVFRAILSLKFGNGKWINRIVHGRNDVNKKIDTMGLLRSFSLFKWIEDSVLEKNIIPAS